VASKQDDHWTSTVAVLVADGGEKDQQQSQHGHGSAGSGDLAAPVTEDSAPAGQRRSSNY